MAPRTLELGPLELQVLGLLSPTHSKSVSDIQTGLKRAGSDLAYTTVMTVLTRLYNKGHLKRVKEGRQYLYVISSKQEEARRSIFDRVKNSLFQSDKLQPILALLDSKESLSAEELKELKKVVDEKLKSVRERT